MRGAAQQLAADGALERADRAAERRLGDVEALGGAAEVQLLGDRHERAQVAHLDTLGGRVKRQHVGGLVHAVKYARRRVPW
jgi:hypothetical protein